MDRWRGRVALVTGASAGIGAAICRQLVEAGMVVVGAARAVERIEALSRELEGKPGTLIGVKCDLNKDGDIENLFEVIKKKYKGVDVCINNAAMSYNDGLLEGTPERWREMLNVNVVALCHCTKESVKSMQERGVGDGHIIHVSSVLGHGVGVVTGAYFYSCTKHAVRALTEGLRQELRDMKSNIRISCISPGYVETEFLGRMMGDEVANKMKSNFPALTAQDVAASICHILAAPLHVQIHDLMIKPNGEMI
ncbi:dehydrogenase/reductase SDR family member 11-like [Macrobrachium rosenbergii]|uniref:dehydrogenase/reductase SDR family member 11-like n=1 Tax=Macrobrachium rosenbergii TaxID=79674 RepID=UPI0034D6498F